ncbi:AbrB/MazE/SpoVT family DNA-binding domain-containing protein [Microbaculum marinum]|uniref:AbrB/MazE/SpoVT family DNA-binding domain-containing protein n=1 Tax=Microbaculum marinum TaxID=1764581 RepID=A0AAW9RR12_9HYPH
MKIRVARWGNSLAVRLPKAAAEELGLEEGGEVDLSVEDGTALLKPVARRGPTLQDLVAEMKRLGPQNEPPFEDWGILPSEWPDEDWSDIAPPDTTPTLYNADSRRKRS